MRIRRRTVSLVLMAGLAVLGLGVVPGAQASASIAPVAGATQTFEYGSGVTGHQYLVYTPAGWTPATPLPLLVMLHGCQTTALQQMQTSLFNPVADRDGFIAVYPDTSPLENAQPGPTARCWQFPSPTDWLRGSGDGAVVAAITKQVMSGWNIDTNRVYVMGMSAGAFLSADVATEYPDIFAASGENAGGAYADGTCIAQNIVALPAALSAQLAFRQEGLRARIVPRIVIGGDADAGIPPACADKALEQGLRTDNLVIDGSQTSPISLSPASVVAGQVVGGHSYTVSNYADEHGCLIGQRYLVHGMGHFWSGGSNDPSLADFGDPQGPSAALASWDFLSRFTLGNTADSC